MRVMIPGRDIDALLDQAQDIVLGDQSNEYARGVQDTLNWLGGYGGRPQPSAK